MPRPAGSVKQNTMDMIGITLFIIFMERAMLFSSSFPVEVCGISLVFSHWVKADRIGIASAPISSSYAPDSNAERMIFKGESEMFSPRK